MPSSRPLRPLALLAMVAALAVVTPVAAQETPQEREVQPITSTPGRSVTFAGGVTQYNLSATGVTGMLGARLTQAFRRGFLVEFNTTFMTYEDQSDPLDQQWYFLYPELQLQLQSKFGHFAPYVGAGGGAVVSWDGDTDVSLTYSGSGGVRYGVTPTVSLVGELRVRLVGARANGGAAEWTLGVMWRPR